MRTSRLVACLVVCTALGVAAERAEAQPFAMSLANDEPLWSAGDCRVRLPRRFFWPIPFTCEAQ